MTIGHTPIRQNPFEWMVDPNGSLRIQSGASAFTLSAAEMARLLAYLAEGPRCLGNSKDRRPEAVPPGDAIGWDFIVGTLGRRGCQMWASHVVGVLLLCELVDQVAGQCGRCAYKAVPGANWQNALRDCVPKQRESTLPRAQQPDQPAEDSRATHGRPDPSAADLPASGTSCGVCPQANPQGTALSVKASRWYVQAERWLNILNKATQYSLGTTAMIENGKAAGPCSYDPRARLLTPPSDNCYEGDVGRSTTTVVVNPLIVAPRPGPSPVRLQAHGNAYPVTAGARGLVPGKQYLLHEPYAEFGARLLGLTQADIAGILDRIKSSATRTTALGPPAGNDVPSGRLDAFVTGFLANPQIPVLLVQGPPGTGKTHTLARTVQQILRNGLTDVVCMAKTKRAVDEISEKLKKLGVAHTNKNRDEQPNHGEPHCCTIDSYLYSRNLQESRRTLLIDEVSQLTLPFTFVAVRRGVLVRLFGDQKQLHPIIPIVEQAARIGPHLHGKFIDPVYVNPDQRESVLNDLPRCATFSGDPAALAAGNIEALQLYDRNAVAGLIRCMMAHPMGQSIFSLDGHPGIAREDKAAIGAIRFRLTQGFRMAEPIQQFPSSRWYGGQLIPPTPARGLTPAGASVLEKALAFPVVFITYDPLGPQADKTSAIEVDILCDIVAHWRRQGEDDFGVVVPFRAQEQEVIGGCELMPSQCATVERFQGRDLDRVAVSLVTSDHGRYLTETRVFTENKYNVAITRARHQLVVVGALSMFDGSVLGRFKQGARTAAFPDLLAAYPQTYLDAVKAHFDHYAPFFLSPGEPTQGSCTAAWLHAIPGRREGAAIEYKVRNVSPTEAAVPLRAQRGVCVPS